ncbi:hypothetical protein [Pedobacter sp. KBW06]|nr:hypothetical protein [Pedobacter sp. KBW06]
MIKIEHQEAFSLGKTAVKNNSQQKKKKDKAEIAGESENSL